MNKSKSKKSRQKNLIFMPILLCLIMCVGIVLVSLPVLPDLVPIVNMFMSDKQVDYSSAYDNIFVPTDNDGDTVNAEDVEFPGVDKQFGELSIKGRSVKAKLFFGDGTIPLRNGVGIYAGSFIPGYGKTILVAGHNNTYFNGLKNVKKDDVVTIKTSYGNYKYQVTGTKVVSADDKSAYDLTSDKENLVMYTCYPFDELGLTEKRFFVYAKKISGPKIVGLYE
jgi:sortase A